MKSNRNQNGFTLVELIIVVVIVGTLVAIAVPLYLHYTETAKVREGLGMMKAIITSQKVERMKTCKFYTAVGDQAPAIFLAKGIDIRESRYFTYETVGQLDNFIVIATATPGAGMTGTISYNSVTLMWSCSGEIIESMLPREPE